MKIKSIFLTASMLVTLFAQSKELPVEGGKLAYSNKVADGDCEPATSSIDLDINNVRALLQNGGDMWWDLSNDARYEVPKVTEEGQIPVSSLFAGAVWIGGIDAQGQLKVAAQTYRQTGNDFFPGPLDDQAAIDKETCRQWDKHFQVFGAEIDSFLDLYETLGGNISSGQVPDNILNWPAYGNPYNPAVGNRNMAPFSDVDGNGYYDPTGGDYPIIDQDCGNNYADQMIWWIYNDKGNIHSETGGAAIGMEVHSLAFAFKTNDEINDMTFYKYNLFNKATSPIDSTFMGKWIDPDLGCYLDDYIGCDIETGLGITYNSSAVDGGSGCPADYGNQPPLIGIDYFQGPLDENGIELGMSSFLYYDNDFTVRGNPENASHFYGYLSGTWKDGTPFTAGGNAYGGSELTNYVFPDDPSDPSGWSECSANNTPADRRIIQSSGPFRLDPGASNEIVVGIVWVRPPVGTYPCPSFDLLKRADEKAQSLFDNCFKILDGPDAPDMSIIELDKELVLALENTTEIESYSQADPLIVALGVADSLYTFEGYQVYQLENSTVSTQEYNDPAKARLIFQCDVKNGVSKLVNFTFDANLGAEVPELMVEGQDKGIFHSIQVTQDAFATDDKRLVNFRRYYFSVVSYAYNYYEKNDTTFDDEGNPTLIVTTTQKKPYLAGRKNIKIYTGIPHLTEPENGGLVINSSYGDGPILFRQEGSGNGGLNVNLTENAVNEILASSTSQSLHPSYQGASGPVAVKVYNPKVIPSADFELGLTDAGTTDYLNAATTTWYLKNLNTGETILSETTLDKSGEQLIPDWGLSVYARQVRNPGGTTSEQLENNNGFITASVDFADAQDLWLAGIPDEEGESPFNWIRSGTYSAGPSADYTDKDNEQIYEEVLDRTWAPYYLTSRDVDYGPAWNNLVSQQIFNKLDSLISVDLVFTPDKSKWTRCVVVEGQPEIELSEGQVEKMSIRDAPSRNLDGSLDATDRGRSWFPGYAINPETGERLNIIFSEDSWLVGENGRDMIYNPTSNIISSTFNLAWGGRHYVYVQRSRYDEGLLNQTNLQLYNTNPSANTPKKQDVYKTVAWCSMTFLNFGYSLNSWDEGIIPTETTVKLRVKKTYERYTTDVNVSGGQPRYTFNTADIAAVQNDVTTATSALDTINIVPNPYYAYSEYEQNPIDNRVKIVNLPAVCTISIFALDGTLVRRFNRDDNSNTYLDWDLKNDAGINISSGLYIIHVDAGELGEKTIKWFGAMRPIDLDQF